MEGPIIGLLMFIAMILCGVGLYAFKQIEYLLLEQKEYRKRDDSMTEENIRLRADISLAWSFLQQAYRGNPDKIAMIARTLYTPMPFDEKLPEGVKVADLVGLELDLNEIQNADMQQRLAYSQRKFQQIRRGGQGNNGN